MNTVQTDFSLKLVMFLHLIIQVWCYSAYSNLIVLIFKVYCNSLMFYFGTSVTLQPFVYNFSAYISHFNLLYMTFPPWDILTFNCILLQCGAVKMQSIFSKDLKIDTP